MSLLFVPLCEFLHPNSFLFESLSLLLVPQASVIQVVLYVDSWEVFSVALSWFLEQEVILLN